MDDLFLQHNGDAKSEACHNLRQNNFLGDGLNALARGRGAEPAVIFDQYRDYGAAENSSDYAIPTGQHMGHHQIVVIPVLHDSFHDKYWSKSFCTFALP